MLNKELILRLSVKPKTDPKISGVYFLVFRDEVVYVGQAVDIFARIRMHRTNRSLIFYKYFYIEYNEKDLRDELERKYIEMLCPKYNIDFNPKAKEDMILAISLMNDDRSYFVYPVRETIGWWMVERIIERNGLESKYKSVNGKLSEKALHYIANNQRLT